MESHFKYQEGMYFQKRDAFFINMYIPSEFSQDDMRLHMECVSQRRQEYELRIQNGTFRKLYLRYPEWADECLLEMDGEVLETKKNKAGYIEIMMHSGDVKLRMNRKKRQSSMDHILWQQFRMRRSSWNFRSKRMKSQIGRNGWMSIKTALHSDSETGNGFRFTK